MLTLKYLHDFFRDQQNIIVDLNISLSNMKRLNDDIYEFENEIKRHSFFQHHSYQLRFFSIIQLAKLFSSRYRINEVSINFVLLWKSRHTIRP